ncbi:MAG: GDP-L-fucose synthase [Pelagibacteraceae bacterium TMED124]|nr:MAG: GDP-L-fucose synthase [Pelagibacteraceae bacterium TMED124]|tara:strand:+ start:4008 stop:5000 length:993 start_codon:yes stop_codon:yes gene_type:complete
MDPKDRIFIAGSNGMVGSALKKLLFQKGYGIKNSEGKLFCPTREDLDLLDYEAVKSWFSFHRPEIVIIAAARVGGILANSSKPYDFIFQNLRIQTNLIEACRHFGIKKIMFLGSSCIYPRLCDQPIKEEYLLKGYLEPTNQWYAIAKIAGIKLCESLKLQYGIDTISLMPCNLYGVGDNYNLHSSHVIPGLIHKFHTAKINNHKKVVCWGSGNPLREFLYVDDLAEASFFVLKQWGTCKDNSEINSFFKNTSWLNVGSGIEIRIKELSFLIAKLVRYEGNIVWDTSIPDGTPRKILDISKIKSLGWEPKIKLEEGLKLAINDFKKVSATF